MTINSLIFGLNSKFCHYSHCLTLILQLYLAFYLINLYNRIQPRGMDMFELLDSQTKLLIRYEKQLEDLQQKKHGLERFKNIRSRNIQADEQQCTNLKRKIDILSNSKNLFRKAIKEAISLVLKSEKFLIPLIVVISLTISPLLTNIADLNFFTTFIVLSSSLTAIASLSEGLLLYRISTEELRFLNKTQTLESLNEDLARTTQEILQNSNHLNNLESEIGNIDVKVAELKSLISQLEEAMNIISTPPSLSPISNELLTNHFTPTK